jgi:hydrogenase-4 component E
MKALIDPVLVVLLLTNLMILGSSRLGGCIRLVAAQGVVLGFLPLLIEGAVTPRLLLLAGGTLFLKGVLFPWMLSRALREAGVGREVQPVVGYSTSLVVGIAALGVALWLSSRLPLPPGLGATHVVPLALFMIQVGLFLIVSRKTALLQVLGYLVLENGIYAFGVGLALREHLLVELGVLLDVFVAVFVMGIIIFHISREFDHIDIDQLSKLKDWHG